MNKHLLLITLCTMLQIITPTLCMEQQSDTIQPAYTIEHYKESSLILRDPHENCLGFLEYALFDGGKNCHVHELEIEDGYRREGYGKALIQEIKHIAIEKKAFLLTLYVNAKNSNAQKFYTAMGFKRTHNEPTRNFYEMAIDLNPSSFSPCAHS